jgi:hypothetical protein
MRYPACDLCGRPAWKSHGGMGGGIMPDHETHCLRRGGRDCRIAQAGREAGVEQGRRKMLWLMAVGLEMTCYLAGCAEHSMSEIWHGWLRNKALLTLASLGDTAAQEILGGGV